MLAVFDRDYPRAIKIIRSLDIPAPSIRAELAGFTAVLETEQSGPKASAPALEDAARQLEGALRDAPGDYQERMALANVYACAGRAEDAIGQAKLAVDLVAKDAYAGPSALQTLAAVYARTGHPDEAIDLIERLLGMNYDDPLTITDLKQDPIWDPLRDNPKFKALLGRSS
jgi:serine/threonine-protein kinase